MSRRGNVLIADDEESFRRSTAALLSDRSLSCRCVGDAEAALEVVDEGWPDVILADINMPGNSKLEFLVQLQEANRDAAIVLVTGYPSWSPDTLPSNRRCDRSIWA